MLEALEFPRSCFPSLLVFFLAYYSVVFLVGFSADCRSGHIHRDHDEVCHPKP